MESSGTIQSVSVSQRLAAWSVHFLTVSGILWAALALNAVFEHRYQAAYFWMGISIVVDSIDGPLARRFNVKSVVPSIDGALLDNIVDYLTWTFVPLILLWRSGWLASPGWLWCTIALVASAMAFVHKDAKVVDAGFFRGFPSYWNFVAFYIDGIYRVTGDGLKGYGPTLCSAAIVFFSILSVSNVYFVYPNRMPKWKLPMIIGGVIWSVCTFALVFQYPRLNPTLFWASLSYPVAYFIVSYVLSRELLVEASTHSR